jgi:hypothetical protein
LIQRVVLPWHEMDTVVSIVDEGSGLIQQEAITSVTSSSIEEASLQMKFPVPKAPRKPIQHPERKANEELQKR